MAVLYKDAAKWIWQKIDKENEERKSGAFAKSGADEI
jgi:hypothetical protein